MDLELFGTFFALIFVFLIVKQQRIAWLFVQAAALLYMFIFWRSGLYNQAILQVFFLFSAAYGFYSWGKDSGIELEPAFGSLTQNLIFITAAAFISWLNWSYAGYLFAEKIVFLDSLTAVFSILATLLATRKKTESWIYWLVIDSLSIYLFITSDLYPTALVYFAYMLMSIWGIKDWIKPRRAEVRIGNPGSSS